MEKVRNHKILNHPIIGGIILIVLALLAQQVVALVVTLVAVQFVSRDMALVIEAGCEIVLAIVMWLLYKLWFKNEFKGAFSFQYLGRGLIILLIPMIAFVGQNILPGVLNDLPLGNVLAAVILGTAPGLFEEITVRGLYVTNAMRTAKSYKDIVLDFFISSFIFGALHFANIIAGADIGITITQVVYATGLGCVFAAACLRTGSLWPSVIVHSLIDISAYLFANLQSTGGVLTSGGIQWFSIGEGIVLILLGFFFIRKSKSQEILDIWNQKWNH